MTPSPTQTADHAAAFVEQLHDLCARRGAKRIDDHGYRQELHRLLARRPSLVRHPSTAA
ncbi:MAG: hypothetical protein AB7H43_06725 [Acidimicrobiia bacterium]